MEHGHLIKCIRIFEDSIAEFNSAVRKEQEIFREFKTYLGLEAKMDNRNAALESARLKLADLLIADHRKTFDRIVK